MESKERIECKATKNLGLLNVSQGPYHREETQVSHRTWNGTQELTQLWGIVSRTSHSALRVDKSVINEINLITSIFVKQRGWKDS